MLKSVMRHLGTLECIEDIRVIVVEDHQRPRSDVAARVTVIKTSQRGVGPEVPFTLIDLVGVSGGDLSDKREPQNIFVGGEAECKDPKWWSLDGVPILFGLGFEAAKLVVTEALEIGKGILHLVKKDELERHFGVREGIVGDGGEEKRWYYSS
ncbi:hypothetical protein TorRG33x02_146980 [Trema orientale]|uniref:Uncharacterized protein n=1 Tax=Trema orientale TaxID=63057 RepID=A0A2P5EVI2_TREOI|nr:hypothetical protein TorRG33x02_146980 [Trema orientale]